MSVAGTPARPGVMWISDRRLHPDRPLPDLAAAAARGGAALLQIREKDLSGRDLLNLVAAAADRVREVPGGRARLLVNGRLDVALAAKAAGVHLPADGLPVAATRRVAPARFLVGRSVHGLAEAREAAKDGADYLVLGPIFATPSKAGAGEPLGPALLRKVAEAVRAPVWAVGGITPETAAELAGIPIAGVAAIRAIGLAPDPTEAVRALRAALGASSDSG